MRKTLIYHFILIQGTISIGGAHIKTGKSLPKDLQQFLDDSMHGVIYFSLGTVVKSSKLPKEIIHAFLSKITLYTWPIFAYIYNEVFKFQAHLKM